MVTGILAGLQAWVWVGECLEEQSKMVIELLQLLGGV